MKDKMTSAAFGRATNTAIPLVGSRTPTGSALKHHLVPRLQSGSTNVQKGVLLGVSYSQDLPG